MGMVARKGTGKVRHTEVGELWIQDAVTNKVSTVNKVKGDDSPADILTKYIEQRQDPPTLPRYAASA